jgi:hypothetical protein
MSAADRALCEAVALPLKESSAEKNARVALGRTGTSERDAGISDSVAQRKDCVARAQQLLIARADPPRSMRHTLERYVDDVRIYGAIFDPDRQQMPRQQHGRTAWLPSAAPSEICDGVGVQPW